MLNLGYNWFLVIPLDEGVSALIFQQFSTAHIYDIVEWGPTVWVDVVGSYYCHLSFKNLDILKFLSWYSRQVHLQPIPSMWRGKWARRSTYWRLDKLNMGDVEPYFNHMVSCAFVYHEMQGVVLVISPGWTIFVYSLTHPGGHYFSMFMFLWVSIVFASIRM